MKLKKVDKNSPDPETVDERIVIYREISGENPRTFYDHPFKLYSEDTDFCSDKDAECPFIEDDDGVRHLTEGYVCFPVSVYKHSGCAFSIGDGSNFPDAQWDVTRNKMWLYTNKELYETHFGPENKWENVSKQKLLELAQYEINELNLDEQGCWFGWAHEKKIKWTKTYEGGPTVHGHDWEEVYGVGLYLVDKLEKIDYHPKNLPVYLHEDVYL